MATKAEKEAKEAAVTAEQQSVAGTRVRSTRTAVRGTVKSPRLRSGGDMSRYRIGDFTDDWRASFDDQTSNTGSEVRITKSGVAKSGGAKINDLMTMPVKTPAPPPRSVTSAMDPGGAKTGGAKTGSVAKINDVMTMPVKTPAPTKNSAISAVIRRSKP